MCTYGKRCTFRHEFRTFKKLHRHYYMDHLAALSSTHFDILDQARAAPAESKKRTEATTPATSDTSDSEENDLFSVTEADRKQQDDEVYRVNGTRRLNCFVLCTQSDDPASELKF